MSIAEEQRYERKIAFFRERLATCGYRFHNLIQTRRKEIPRLAADPSENTYQEVEHRVLGATDTFINCLAGEHYATEVPEYLTQEYPFPYTGPIPSRASFTRVSPLGTCLRRTGCRCLRRSSRRRTLDLLRMKNQSAIILIQPRCSSTASSPADGMAKLPFRSKRNVRDYQYLSRPDESVKTRIGSYYLSLINSYNIRTVGIYFSPG